MSSSFLALWIVLLTSTPFCVALHPPIILPRQGEGEDIQVAAIESVSRLEITVRETFDAEPTRLSWREVRAERKDLEAANLLLLYEAYKETANGDQVDLRLGSAVHSALQRNLNIDFFREQQQNNLRARRPSREERAPRESREQAQSSSSSSSQQRDTSAHNSDYQEVTEDQFEFWENCTWVENEWNDGDSFHFLNADGEEFILRLYFVDCPETDREFRDRIQDQAESFDITQLQNQAVGQHAKEVTKHLLSTEPFTVITAQQDALGNSELPRIYGFVLLNNRESTSSCEALLSQELTLRGLTRIYGQKVNPPGEMDETAVLEQLEEYQQRSQDLRLGGWTFSDSLD